MSQKALQGAHSCLFFGDYIDTTNYTICTICLSKHFFIGNSDAFYLSLPYLAINDRHFDKITLMESCVELSIDIYNFYNGDHLRTFKWNTQNPWKHIVFKNNIFYVYCLGESLKTFNIQLFSAEDDENNGKEISMETQRKIKRDRVSISRFRFRSFLNISQKYIIRMEEDKIVIYKFV